MAKESGIGDSLYVAQYDLSGDIGAVTSASSSRATLPVSAINQSAEDRLVGRRDGALAFSSYWNIVAGQAHPVLSALPTTDRIVSYFHGSTVGNPAASMVSKLIDYAPTFGSDGSLVVANSAVANGYGLEWSGGGSGDGMLTTGLQSFATGTVSGTSIDLGAVSTLFGAAAYLHCTVMPSGTLTVTVEDSANDIAFSTVTGMVFTNLTGPGSERVQGAVGATVRRYVRVTCSGVHGTASVAVNFIRYLTSSAA
jgi:hypothetical protein